MSNDAHNGEAGAADVGVGEGNEATRAGSDEARDDVPRRSTYLRSGPPKQGLEPVDDVIAGVIERFGAPGVDGGRVVSAWADLAGEWADRAVPIGVRDGVLTVEVANGADASIMRYDEAAIRARINAEVGVGIVTKITVRVGRNRGSRNHG